MKKERALTPEQQKLVEDNHNLIYHILNKMNLDIEEYYGLAAIGLCQAARNYSNTKAKFSTYACFIMRAVIHNEFTRKNAQKRDGIVLSLNEPVPNTIDLTFGDMVFDNDTPETVAIANEILKTIDKFPEKQRKAMQLALQGYKYKEICKVCDSTPKGVSMLINYARKTLKANGFA